MNESEFLSPEGLANLLDVPVASVYAWRHRGIGPKGSRVGKHVRYRRSDVDAWLDVNAASTAPKV